MTNAPKNKDRSRKEARDTRTEALKIANSQHIEGQTKEQTRLIAKGIQKGMEQFLRQQNEKTREIDRRSKKIQQMLSSQTTSAVEQPGLENHVKSVGPSQHLPWLLLGVSWILFIAYVLFYNI